MNWIKESAECLIIMEALSVVALIVILYFIFGNIKRIFIDPQEDKESAL